MELRDVDRFVREGKYEQALKAIDMVRSYEPDNPYTAAYEVRVRALLEGASGTPSASHASILPGFSPSDLTLPSVESQLNAIAKPAPVQAPPPQGPISRGTAGEMERLVVLSRIADLLGNATGALSEGDYSRAIDALEQARVLDPANTEIAMFEQRLRATQRDSLLAHHPQEFSAAAPLDPGVSEIPGMLDAAREAAARGDFREALRTVTTAAILEPASPEVARCEKEIRAIQEERHLEEVRRKASERRQRENGGRNHEEIADAEQERRHTASQIARHVATARALLEAGEFGHALVEIDKAFLLNPLDVEVRALQQEISSAQERVARESDESSRTRASMIAGYLADAHRLRVQGKPDEALQVIGRLLLLEPSNEEALGFERKLQAEIAAATPLLSITDLPSAPVGQGPPSKNDHKNRSRRNRKATYLAAASLLATAVLVLLSLTQMLSRADNPSFIPEPSPAGMVEQGQQLVNGEPGAAGQTGGAKQPAVGNADGAAGEVSVRKPAEATLEESVPGILRLEQPELPDKTIAEDAVERVTVRVLVDSTGRAVLTAIANSTNSALDQPVINAVMRSSYTPWSGQPVSKWITIPLRFTN